MMLTPFTGRVGGTNALVKTSMGIIQGFAPTILLISSLNQKEFRNA
jgi:hypothetical protein